MDFFMDLGRIGLGSRLKRLSDNLISEVNAIYKDAGITLEASCFPLLSITERYGPLTLREAEEKLGVSHSYISQKAKHLQKKNFIELKTDPQDKRSKKLQLTADGKKLMQEAKPHWIAMDRAMANLLHPQEEMIFNALNKLDKALLETPLRKEIKHHYDGNLPKINFVEYNNEFKDIFKRLNNEWLDKSFKVAAFDLEAFKDPQKNIIDKGGQIFFAMINGLPVGTAALYPEDNHFELCKMGVDPRYRGMKIGQKLIEEAFRRAREKDVKTLTLLTNTKKLPAAYKLYKRMGFKEIPLTEADITKYGNERLDIRMKYSL